MSLVCYFIIIIIIFVIYNMKYISVYFFVAAEDIFVYALGTLRILLYTYFIIIIEEPRKCASLSSRPFMFSFILQSRKNSVV